MADLGCTSPQERGKIGMPVVDMCCPGTSSVGRAVDCLDIEGIVVEIVDIGQGSVGIGGIARFGVLIAGLVMILD